MISYESILDFWKSRRITTDAQLAEIMNGSSISYAYHSGKIENDNITYHDTREIFEHDEVVSYTGDLKTLFEIAFTLKRKSNLKFHSLYLNRKVIKGIADSMDVNLGKLRETVRNREAWHAAFHEVLKSRT